MLGGWNNLVAPIFCVLSVLSDSRMEAEGGDEMEIVVRNSNWLAKKFNGERKDFNKDYEKVREIKNKTN